MPFYCSWVRLNYWLSCVFLDTPFAAYFIPFNGILGVTGCNLSLVNDLSFYSTNNNHTPENANTTTLGFKHLKSPLVFYKLAVAMKEHTRKSMKNGSVTAADTLEMVAMHTAADEATKNVLLNIQAQLKRQNELLEASLPNGSIV